MKTIRLLFSDDMARATVGRAAAYAAARATEAAVHAARAARISDAAREILTTTPYDGTGPHLAAYIGVSLRTAWRAVRELESEGLIVRTSTHGRCGGLRD